MPNGKFSNGAAHVCNGSRTIDGLSFKLLIQKTPPPQYRLIPSKVHYPGSEINIGYPLKRGNSCQNGFASLLIRVYFKNERIGSKGV